MFDGGVTFLGFSQLSGRPLLHCTALHCTALHCTADGKVAAQQVRHVCRVAVTTDDVRHAELSGMTYHTASVANSRRHHQVTVAHLQWLFTQVSICKCYKQFVKLVIFLG